MRIRSIGILGTLLLALHAVPAAARERPRVRMCFAEQPSTAVREGEVFDSGDPRIEEYVLRVARGQKLRLELQPLRRFGELAPPEGMRATLTWPDGSKQEPKAPLLFDGVVARAGDLLIRIAPADRGTTHYFRLTATADKPTDCSPGERMERWVGELPEKLWAAEPMLEARVRKLLGKQHRQYVKRTATLGAIEKSGKALLIEGCATHMCGVDAASLYISLPDDKLHCLLLFDGKRAELFSEDPRHLPPGLITAQASVGPSGAALPAPPTPAPAAPADAPSQDAPAPLRVFKNRKHPPVEHPIFAGSELLGGWNGQAFTTIDFEKLAVPVGEDPSERVAVKGLFKNGTKVRFFRGAKLAKTARAGNLIHATEQMYGEHSLTWPDSLPGGVVGVGGDWDPVPRKVVVSGDKSVIKDAVVQMLSHNGIKKASKPAISRVLQVDLDNDGADDFLVVAHRKQAYFLIALFTPAKERAIQIGFDKDEDGMDSLNGVDAFDANGDGKMELLIDRSAIESHSVILYELRDGKVVPAFSGQ